MPNGAGDGVGRNLVGDLAGDLAGKLADLAEEVAEQHEDVADRAEGFAGLADEFAGCAEEGLDLFDGAGVDDEVESAIHVDIARAADGPGRDEVDAGKADAVALEGEDGSGGVAGWGGAEADDGHGLAEPVEDLAEDGDGIEVSVGNAKLTAAAPESRAAEARAPAGDASIDGAAELALLAGGGAEGLFEAEAGEGRVDLGVHRSGEGDLAAPPSVPPRVRASSCSMLRTPPAVPQRTSSFSIGNRCLPTERLPPVRESVAWSVAAAGSASGTERLGLEGKRTVAS